MNEITKTNKQEILSPLEWVDKKIAAAMKSEFEADKGWADVGVLLEEVRKNDLWKERHESFNDYLISLEEKHKKHRSQLHHYRNVAGLLEEYTTPKQLNTMGIAKASVLAKSVKQGSVPAADVIEAALKPTNRVEDVRKLLFDSSPLNGQTGQEKGTYHDLGGIYATAEEWQEICKAFALATHIDPVISESLPDPVRTKEILLRMAQECIAEWEPSLQN